MRGNKRDVEAANGIFKTPATGIKLFLPAIYLRQLLNVRSPRNNPECTQAASCEQSIKGHTGRRAGSEGGEEEEEYNCGEV